MKYSNIINPLVLLRSKIPLFILTVQMSVTNIAFTPCPNSITPFLVYFSIISILCLLYEGFHSYINYNQIEDKLKKWVMVISSTLISYLSFFAVSYYVPGGKPFSCYSNYSSVTSTIIFYLTFCLVYVYSYVEHHFILKENNIDEDDMGIELTESTSSSSI